MTNILIALSWHKMLRLGIPFLSEVFFYAILLNLALAIFNLIRSPSGRSRVVSSFLPKDLEKKYAYLEPYGLLIVIVLLNMGWLDFVPSLIYGACA